MHILLGLIGSIVTVMWILYRLAEMGIDLGGLNPWLWRRRRNWRSRYEANPIFSIESPMEVTALLMAGVAKASGDISATEKRWLLQAFQQDFELDEHDAAGLLASSTHLLGDGSALAENIQQVIAPSAEKFRDEQRQIAIRLIEGILRADGKPTGPQTALAEETRAALLGDTADPSKWS